jgi:serine/threonine-protein kinase
MRQLEGFELIEEVSRTPFSIIYKARELDQNRWVFLKLYPTAPSPNPEMHRYVHEASTLAALFPPTFQQILGIPSNEEGQWQILEYFDGRRLDQVLAGPPIALDRAIELARKLALGVREAHCFGVAHCNLRLSNIYLVEGEQIKITGFEYAKRLWNTINQPNPHEFSSAELETLNVPPDPIAPEQRLGITRAIGLRTDVYAWGVILYQLINWTTTIPPDEVEEKIETGTPGRERSGFTLLPGCPFGLEAICRKCLQFYSRDRYPDGKALVDDLERFLGSL